MNKKMKWAGLAMVILLVGTLSLSAQNGKGLRNGQGNGTCTFVDENGDGINDNFRDHDGDGIPNHLDADWTRPQDGSGNRSQGAKGKGLRAKRQVNSTNRFAESRQMRQGFGTGAGGCNGTGQAIGGGRRGGRRG